MRLVDFVALARERVALIIVVVAVAVAAVLGLALVQEPVYAASARLQARSDVAAVTTSQLISEENPATALGTQAELLRSSAVAERVARAVGGDAEDLLDSVAVTKIPDTLVLRVTARAETPERAIAVANAFADSYLEVRRERINAALDAESDRQARDLRAAVERIAELDPILEGREADSPVARAASAERDQLLAQLVVIRTRTAALADRAAVTAVTGEVVQPATEADAERDISMPRAIVFGLVIGLPLAFAAVLVLDSLRNTVRTGEEVSRLTGAELVGTVLLDPGWEDPHAARLVTLEQPLAPVSESYRTLGHNLNRLASATGASTILFTGPAGSGTTSVVANLGVALADAGRPASLVEADLRHPRLHRFFRAEGAPGLTDVLREDAAVADVLQPVDGDVMLLPAGHIDGRPDLLVRRGGIADVLSGLVTAPVPRPRSTRLTPMSIAGRFALLDTASILEAAEVSSMAAHVDGVVIVARASVTTKHELAASAEQVRRAGGTILGAVIVGVRSFADAGPVFEPAAAPTPLGVERSVVG